MKLQSQLAEDHRAALVKAIKARARSGSLGAPIGPLDPIGARAPTPYIGPIAPRSPPSSDQRLPFNVLLDWCFRLVQDPLAIPYALAIERFCPREATADDNPENFEAQARKADIQTYTELYSTQIEGS